MSEDVFRLNIDNNHARSVSDKDVSRINDYVQIRHRLYRTQSYREEFCKKGETSECFTDTYKKKIQNSCSLRCFSEFIYGLIPLLNAMKKYQWKHSLLGDIIAGLTVGVMILPQGMAYAMLAELPPVIGLYVSFFPVLIYFFLGTSRHVNIGAVAVISLMVGSVVLRYTSDETNDTIASPGLTEVNSTFRVTRMTLPEEIATESTTSMKFKHSESDIINKRIGIAATISFMTGLIQIGLGVMRLGLVTTYMSDALIGGFTTAVATHVFTSQVKSLLGLRIPSFPGVFQIIFTYKTIFENIDKTNMAELGMSLVSIVILYIVKVQINQRFKKKLKFPIPIELMLVIIATASSHFWSLREQWGIQIVGHIPAGIPKPSLPSFHAATGYISDSFIIAVVAFAQSVSLVSLLAKRYQYETDSNQELIAYGFGNLFSSFFSCFPFAASLSRSSVQEGAGGKSQIACLVSASLVLVVILWVGPLFESLPTCVLSAVIVVALRSMFLQILELSHLWKVSVYEFCIWLVTFFSSVILHVDFGLLIGILFSFYTVILRTQREPARQLAKLTEVGIYEDSTRYTKMQQDAGIKVVGYNCPLYYANADMFLRHVYNVTGVNPGHVRKLIKKWGSLEAFRQSRTPEVVQNGNRGLEISISPGSNTSKVDNSKTKQKASVNTEIEMIDVHTIVIDCTGIIFVDITGVNILKQIFFDYESVCIKVLLAAVKDSVWSVLQETGFTEKYSNAIYISVDDAVLSSSSPSNEVDTGSVITYI